MTIFTIELDSNQCAKEVVIIAEILTLGTQPKLTFSQIP
jgi:hypothetical protein